MRIFKIRCSAIGMIMSNAKAKGELSQTCKSYLHEWYANDREDIHSKYMEKGKAVEGELIDFMADVLGYFGAEKNTERKADDFIVGECDVILHDAIVDVKAPWSKKTLNECASGMNSDYEWQGRGYMHLFKRDSFILFYGLMNTPASVNYGKEVIYSNLPKSERWLAYKIANDESKIDEIIAKVVKCREYLAEYHEIVSSKLGRING